jgi:hypothetical protein
MAVVKRVPELNAFWQHDGADAPFPRSGRPLVGAGRVDWKNRIPSTATQHGGQESSTILTFIPTLMHLGMVVVGLHFQGK